MKKIIFILFIFSNLSSQDFNKNFQKGNEYFSNKKYSDAIVEYETIINSGNQSFELYYNLGTTYFKINNLGKSIYYFEKAKKINPTDEDVLFNLRFAESRKIDKIDVIPEFFLKIWINNWYEFILTKIGFTFLYILFVIGLSLVICIYLFTVINKNLFYSGVLLFLLTFFSILIYEYGNYESENKNQGIITTSIINIKLTPSIESEDAFLLHEGTKFILLDKVNGWYKLKLADGKIGWINENNFGKI
ncbi:MAG: tetratricopeptide repeat protein [Bacteroidetes bacterium]|nr:tetratricopeptide repeat protein [Bacteroidota bacterium]